MSQPIVRIATLNMSYAKLLVADLTDAQMTAQPLPDRRMNHPAWIMGHLCLAAQGAAIQLGLTPTQPAEWKDLFGMASKPLADAAYPSKAVLVETFEQTQDRVVLQYLKAPADVLTRPAPERARGRYPTVGDMVAFLLTGHASLHLGQLSAWRRAMGLPPVL